ncbi:MAG: hypothetical protein WC712_14115 [Candidatus Brocadiia bacterium]
MPEGLVSNGKVVCPSCGSNRFSIYRRSVQKDDTILCMARCDKCDATFTVAYDRSGAPTSPELPEEGPKLPFEREE